jgi:hypothetical protein
VSAAGAIVLASLPLLSAGCGNILGPGSCDVSYVVRANENPETGIRFINELSSGLQVIVESGRVSGIGSDMAPGSCEVYGLFAGDYIVSFHQCAQNDQDTTVCTSTFGPEIRRTVSVGNGEITELRVNQSWFR